MEVETNKEGVLERVLKILRSGSIIDLIAKISDYTFMIVSLPIVGSITITLLGYINEAGNPSSNRLYAILLTIILFSISYFLNRERIGKITKRKLTFDDWSVKIFSQLMIFLFYLLYSASLTALLISVFQKEFGVEINSQIQELLPEVMQFYFFLLFIALPATIIIITIATYISIKSNFEGARKNRRIFLGLLLTFPFLFLRQFLDNYDFTTIDIDKATRIVSLLVGPLIIYIIRILFFRKWIKIDN